MAYKSKSGLAFTNKPMALHQDELDKAHALGNIKDKKSPGKEKSVEDVVAKHGPASKAVVHTTHGDHTHSAEFNDPESAKDHLDKAFGVEDVGENLIDVAKGEMRP
jgi:hypothetical protein